MTVSNTPSIETPAREPAELWMSGDDGIVYCPAHVGPELRSLLPTRPKGSFNIRTETEGYWTRISATLAVLAHEECEVCGAAPTDAGLNGEPPVTIWDGPTPEWNRVPFPKDWIDDVAWPWIAQVAYSLAAQGGMRGDSDTESSMRASFRASDDGTILYRDDLCRMRLELVEAPGYGCWLRTLTVPVLPGHPGSVQREKVKGSYPVLRGPDDPATIIRTLFHLIAAIEIEDDATGPAGDANLSVLGPLDVAGPDGAVLARALDEAAALALLRGLAGPDGTVHIVNRQMKAFAAVPDPNGGRWLDHGHGRLVATATQHQPETIDVTPNLAGLAAYARNILLSAPADSNDAAVARTILAQCGIDPDTEPAL